VSEKSPKEAFVALVEALARTGVMTSADVIRLSTLERSDIDRYFPPIADSHGILRRLDFLHQQTFNEAFRRVLYGGIDLDSVRDELLRIEHSLQPREQDRVEAKDSTAFVAGVVTSQRWWVPDIGTARRIPVRPWGSEDECWCLCAAQSTRNTCVLTVTRDTVRAQIHLLPEHSLRTFDVCSDGRRVLLPVVRDRDHIVVIDTLTGAILLDRVLHPHYEGLFIVPRSGASPLVALGRYEGAALADVCLVDDKALEVSLDLRKLGYQRMLSAFESKSGAICAMFHDTKSVHITQIYGPI
jgi:hypothetical protein